jgi:hypothetical protein
MNCPHCDSSKMRTSRFRFGDVSRFLLLRMPVRCRNCQERSYTSISKAMHLRRDAKLRRASEKSRGSEAPLGRPL